MKVSDMTTKSFIIRILVHIILFAVISAVAMTVIESPLIENDIALGQMDNSDSSFMLYELYQKLVNIAEIVYVVICAIFALSIICHVEKFIRQKIKERKLNEEKLKTDR